MPLRCGFICQVMRMLGSCGTTVTQYAIIAGGTLHAGSLRGGCKSCALGALPWHTCCSHNGLVRCPAPSLKQGLHLHRMAVQTTYCGMCAPVLGFSRKAMVRAPGSAGIFLEHMRC